MVIGVIVVLAAVQWGVVKIVAVCTASSVLLNFSRQLPVEQHVCEASYARLCGTTMSPTVIPATKSS